MAVSEFEIQGFRFQLKHLPILESLDLLPVALESLPYLAIAKAAQEREDASGAAESLRAYGAAIRKLGPLPEAFAKHCTVFCSDAPLGVSMVDALKTLFPRKHLLLLEWTFRSMTEEFGDFLPKASLP
jgi:hypothetical protein